MQDYYRVLAIDFGKKRVGLAISDLMRIIVKPLEYILVNENTDLIENIAKIVEQENVKKIILGIPEKNVSNSNLVDDINEFAGKLREKFSFEVILVDESFSSQKAVETMLATGKKKKYRQEKGHTDSFSAAIILKEFLENEI